MTITRRILFLAFFLISGIAMTVSQASLAVRTGTQPPLADAGGTDTMLRTSLATLTGSPTPPADAGGTDDRAISRRAPSINGRLEGSIQQLTPENVTLNGGATITEKLYVPGTPTVRRNGNPNFGGVIEGSGSAVPTNYQVTLNGNATLGNLVNRTNPFALTPVPAPPTPTGTRDVNLNNLNDQIGDFATLRNLILNGNAGTRSVPPGTYGNFTVNGSSVLIFGIANATEPAVYNLQGLTLNGGTQLQIVGPVTLTLRNGTNINGTIGNAANPQWLTLNVSNGGVTLNGGSQMFGKVNAPSGSVTVNSRLTGNIICDRLTVNGGGVVTILAQAPQDTTAPVITIAEPVQGLITKTSPVTVSGTVTDASAVTVTVNGQPVTLSGGQFSTSVTVAEGSNTITVLATDTFGNVGTASRNVTLDTIAPVLTVTSPQDGAVTTEAQLTITGTVTDATATTVTVNNVAANRNGNEFSAVVSLTEGPNTFVIRAEDAAGNQTEATRTVTLQAPQDTTPPVITLTEPAEGLITNISPLIVSGTVTDASTVTVTVNNQPATLSGTQFAASVVLTEGSNTIAVSAADAFGNTASATRNVILDTIAPVLTITTPEDGDTTIEDQITVAGTVTDTAAVSVTVNNIAATLNGNEFLAVIPLLEGPNTLLVRASDVAGNQSELAYSITRQPPPPLSLTVVEPTIGAATQLNKISVRGTVTGTGATVSVNGSFVNLVGGTFFQEVDLVDGENTIQVVATNPQNEIKEVTRTVTVDKAPPLISNLSPSNDSIIDSDSVTIEGDISDLVATTIMVGDDSVTENNGHFVVPNIPLIQGNNYIRILAVDAAGNYTKTELHLIGKDRTSPPAPIVFSVISPTRLSFQSLEGDIEPGAQLEILNGIIPVTDFVISTAGHFLARVSLNPGTNVFSIKAIDPDGNVSPETQVSIMSNPSIPLPPTGQPFQINSSTGNAQRGLANTELPRPLVVFITDQQGNPVPGVPVQFTVKGGNGHFVDGSILTTTLTDTQGHAAARYISGPEPGIQLVRASFEGNTLTQTTFLAQVLGPSSDGVTRLTGNVYDQNLRALPNVLIRLGGQQTRTGMDGSFSLENVAAGPNQVLEAIGRDQVSFPGRWPNISYDIDVLSGVNNRLGRPIFLPRVNDGIQLPLNEQNVVVEDTTYELPVTAGESPIRVVARAGTQVLFPPDITDKRFSVTRIPTDRIPMPLEDGRATNLYISVQPSGTIFDPPLEVTFPNLDHQPADSKVLLMSFDHDAGRYVQVGTGRVSEDGKTVSGDPGSGIRVGAWHGFPPNAPPPDTDSFGGPTCSGDSGRSLNGIVNLGDAERTETCYECSDYVACGIPGIKSGGVVRATLPSSLGTCSFLASNCAEPPVKIILSWVNDPTGTTSNDITGKTNQAIIGQRLKIIAEVQNASEFINPQWVIQGEYYQDYFIDPSTIPTYGPNVNIPKSGIKKPLTPVNAFRQSLVNFFWVDGGQHSLVFVITVKGTTYTARTTFDVYKPSSKFETEVDKVIVRKIPVGSSTSDYELMFGIDIPFPPGIKFISEVDTLPPPFDTWGAKNGTLQLVSLNRVRVLTANSQTQSVVSPRYDYDQLFPFGDRDSPSEGLDLSLLEKTVSDQFQTWLMFKPNQPGDQSAWVPLKKLNWFWQGKAKRVIPSKNWVPNPASSLKWPSPPPVGEETTEIPVWQGNVVDYILNWK